MAGIARANTDWATTHTPLSGGTPHIEPAQTIYLAGAGSSVYVNGQPAIVLGDSVACGELTIEASSTVFIGGKGVHRLGDRLESHAGTFTPSVCAVASGDVFAGG